MKFSKIKPGFPDLSFSNLYIQDNECGSLQHNFILCIYEPHSCTSILIKEYTLPEQ
jgi:hypothetical protein